MKNYISLYKLIDQRDIIENADRIFEAFKNFVADTSRGKRRERILRTSISDIRPHGIFDRLIYHYEDDKVEYICGQEWYSEMRVLRDCFDEEVG